jgi:hypothetical protein
MSGQHNISVHDQSSRIPFSEQQSHYPPSTRTRLNIPDRHETRSAHALSHRTEQVFAPGFTVSTPTPTQPHVDHRNEDTILNRYTSQHVQSILHGVDQFSQNFSGQLTGNIPNTEQHYFRNYDDPMQRHIPIGSVATGPFHLTNRSHMQQIARQPHSVNVNSSTMSVNATAGQSITRTVNRYNTQTQYSGLTLQNKTAVMPQQYLQHHHPHPYQERPADFVTSPEDVEIGFALLSPQLQTRTQSHEAGLLISPHPIQQPSDDHNYTIPQASFQVTLPFTNTESSRLYLQPSRDNSAVNQSDFFQQSIDDQNFNAHQTTYQATQPYRGIASALPYLQHSNDNNVIHQAGSILQVAQQYVQTGNNSSRYSSNGNGTRAQQMPSGSAQAQHQQQSGSDQNNQSSDESQFWEY